MDYKGPIEAILSTDLRGEPYNFSLWDVQTGSQLVVFKGNKSNPTAKCVHFIDNNYFVTAVDSVIQVWSIYNRKCQEQKLFLPGRPSVLCLSPCGNYLVAGISEMIYIWELKSGNLLSHTQRHYQTVSVLRFNNDGTFLISGGEDGMVLVWPFADLISNTHNTGALNLRGSKEGTGVNEPRFTWQHNSSQITDLCLTNSNYCWTSSADSTANLYNYLDGKRLFCISFPTPIWSVIMNTNETSLFLGGQDGSIYQLATSSISLSQMNAQKDGSHIPVFTGHEGKITSMLISMDGTRLISASNDSYVKIWSIQQKKMLQSIKHQAPLANMVTVIIPDSFALTSMNQSHTKPPLSVKPLKRQLYKPPRDATISKNDLFEESSERLVNVKNVADPMATTAVAPEKPKSSEIPFDIKTLQKATKNSIDGVDDRVTNGHSENGGKTENYRERLRDLYLVSAEKIFRDSANESLKPFKTYVDKMV